MICNTQFICEGRHTGIVCFFFAFVNCRSRKHVSNGKAGYSWSLPCTRHLPPKNNRDGLVWRAVWEQRIWLLDELNLRGLTKVLYCTVLYLYHTIPYLLVENLLQSNHCRPQRPGGTHIHHDHHPRTLPDNWERIVGDPTLPFEFGQTYLTHVVHVYLQITTKVFCPV